MTCSARLDPAPSDLDLTDAAAALYRQMPGRATVLGLTPLAGGGNNRLYRVDTRAGPFALKAYGPPDVRGDRLGREFDGLRFLTAAGVGDIPAALAVDRDRRLALYSWVDGAPAQAVEIGTTDIDQAVALVMALRHVSRKQSGDWQGEAAEACLSAGTLLAQIDGRLQWLRAVDGEPALHDFLAGRLEPAHRQAGKRLADLYAGAGLDPAAAIAPACRVLSPSDFGFHNALRGPDNRLTFIDFEYFGWDDPVKLTADFLWHPGMRLSLPTTGHWRAAMERLFAADDPAFSQRLTAQLPLYALRWSLIILNEFLPERWRRRVFAGQADPADWQRAKAGQLAKAEALLQRAFTADALSFPVPLSPQ